MQPIIPLPTDFHLSSSCRQVLDSIVDCLYEGICVVNAQGTVLLWNKGSERLYGIPAQKIVGANIREFFPHALVDEVRQTRVAQENVYHSPREGSHILISAVPLIIDGQFMGAVSSDRDYAEVSRLYTELGEAEQKLLFLSNEIKRVSNSFGEIVGNSAKFRKRVNVAHQVAPTDTSIMLTGESGTGKEIFARGIHEISGRKGLFVPVNCSAIPGELFESEFFGYAPGAFTGAGRGGKPGFFELANGGTLFLDELNSMPSELQPKLLRALQDHRVRRVGSSVETPVSLKVISALNASPSEAIERGQIRADLFYRLGVVMVHLPPLRERRGDISLLLNHFVDKFNRTIGKKVRGFTPAAFELLKSYHWPGNVREMEHAVEATMNLIDEDAAIVDVSHLRAALPLTDFSAQLSTAGFSNGPTAPAMPAADVARASRLGRTMVGGGAPPAVEEAEPVSQPDGDDYDEYAEETERLTEALRKSRGNVARAAKSLGYSPQRLHYRLKKLGLDSADFKR